MSTLMCCGGDENVRQHHEFEARNQKGDVKCYQCLCPTGWILVRRACEQNSTCEAISQQNRVAAVCMVARLCA